MLVVDGLEVGVEGGGDVGALDFHHQLALVDVVAQADVESDDAAVGEGENGDLAGDVGIDGAGDLELAADGLG